MKDLFVNTQLPVVTSDRILYTPSNFARTSLLYLQEIGSLRVHKPHSTGRSNLSSYLFFTVTDGEGELICEGRTYSLRTGDCVFIDCRKQYAHSSSEKLWSLSWIHFYSPYAVAKQYGFWMVKEYRDAYGMFAVNGILFNHESERRGENFVTRKITLAAGRIAEGLQDHLELGNMDSLRDWGYAKDYVECMWLIMQQENYQCNPVYKYRI